MLLECKRASSGSPVPEASTPSPCCQSLEKAGEISPSSIIQPYAGPLRRIAQGPASPTIETHVSFWAAHASNSLSETLSFPSAGRAGGETSILRQFPAGLLANLCQRERGLDARGRLTVKAGMKQGGPALFPSFAWRIAAPRNLAVVETVYSFKTTKPSLRVS